jgi:hypothetical protein
MLCDPEVIPDMIYWRTEQAACEIENAQAANDALCRLK